MATARPYTACLLIIRDEDRIAFVLRKNTDWMNGNYGVPAGKVEEGEKLNEAAIREAKEEVGITIEPKDLKFIHLLHNIYDGWINVVFEVLKYDGTIYNAEPDVHAEVAWFTMENLPKNIIPSGKFILEQIQAGNIYSEYNPDLSVQ